MEVQARSTMGFEGPMEIMPPIAEDLLEGAAAISAELGVSPRRGYRLLEKGAIPGFKLAGKWYARRSTLKARIADLERAGEA